jgi:putative ABC transport system permease protein
LLIRALDRKLLRDLWGIRGQAFAIALVMAAGIATFIMSLSTLQSLRRSRDAYYLRSRFGEVFVRVKRMPLTVAERLREIPGVRDLCPRIVTEVSLDIPNFDEPAIGRLISLPENSQVDLSLVHLRRGRMVDPQRDREIIVSEAFAQAHKLDPGDRIRVVLNGRYRDLEIVGIGLSPEYLIQIREGSLLPDELRFGVFWMSQRHLAAALNMEEATNDICMSLWPGANEAEVLRQVDTITEAYGGIGAYGRADQISHHYITQEIEQLTSMGVLIPSIFLGVAAFLLNVVTSRLMRSQREQVAAMRALGYGRWSVGWHYLKLVWFLVMVGVILGSLGGIRLGDGLTGLYGRFYRFPTAVYRCDVSLLALGLLIAGGAGTLGTFLAIWRAMTTPPAQAMRPEPPANFRPTMIERLGLGRMFSLSARMILRQLERRPTQSIFSILGIAMAVSILIVGSFSEDAVRHMINYQFNRTQRQDVTVAFFEPRSLRGARELEHLPGVLRCEPFRSVPCRIRVGHRSRRTAIQGLPPDGNLFVIRDKSGAVLKLSSAETNELRRGGEVDITRAQDAVVADGVMLSEKLAEILDVGVGDEVEVDIMEGLRPKKRALVTALVREYGGLNAYMSRQSLNRWMREESSISGAFLQVDSREIEKLYADLKRIPSVASVTIREAAIESFDKTVAENLMTIRGYNIFFASIIAIGVVYNGARVSLAERSREFASLRVMGFTRREVSALLLGELGMLTLAAIPLGLGMGYGFAAWASIGMDTELFRVPLVVNSSTFGMATLVTLIATIISGMVVRRNVDHLDLIAVLKTKE